MPETGLVDVLTTKIVAWEAERGKEFTYDGVSFLIPVLFFLGRLIPFRIKNSQEAVL
jgi:hypothetical protein